jgi:hypothetical protein
VRFSYLTGYTIFVMVFLFVCCPAWATIEDLTTYIEVDNDGDYTVTATGVVVDTARRDCGSSIYKDFGADHFGEYEHLLEVEIIGTSGSFPLQNTWHLSNVVAATRTSMDTNNNGVQVTIFNDNLYYRQEHNPSEDSYDASTGNVYYLTIMRDASTQTMEIYSDEERTTLLDTLSITFNGTAYRYAGPVGGHDSGFEPSSTTSYHSGNMDFQEAAALGSGKPNAWTLPAINVPAIY